MAQIPEQPEIDWNAKLANWFILKQKAEEAQKAIVAERLARAEIFAHFFPSPTEGTNNHTLPDGYVLKGKYPIERKVDEGSLAGLKLAKVGECLDMLRELNMPVDGVDPNMLLVEFMRLPLDGLLKYTPELAVKQYRTLTAEQAKVMDMCMLIKPGSIALEIAPPSTKAPKAAPGVNPFGNTQEQA